MADLMTAGRKIIKSIVPNVFADKDLKPHEFISKYWNTYCEKYDSNQSLNGQIFEDLIAMVLIREKILPFYMQAKVAFIPNVNYDFIIYNDATPISLSAKTSLRERYKQADLEAVALKYIHRNAKSYLITLDEAGIRPRRRDMTSCMALNDFVLASSPEFDKLINELKNITFKVAPEVKIVTSNILVTQKNCKTYF